MLGTTFFTLINCANPFSENTSLEELTIPAGLEFQYEQAENLSELNDFVYYNIEMFISNIDGFQSPGRGLSTKNLLTRILDVNHDGRLSPEEIKEFYNKTRVNPEDVKRSNLKAKTLLTKKGDCSDQTILLMKLSNMKFGIEPIMKVFFGIKNDSVTGHAVMEYDNKIYDPSNGWVFDNVDKMLEFYKDIFTNLISYELSYNDAMSWVTEE